MATGSNSTKKAAKLAQQRGGSTGPRFQGGGVFPLVMALVIVIGVGSIVWARQTRSNGVNEQPSIDVHWHAAYGVDICGTWYQFEGDLESPAEGGGPADSEFSANGIHSHDDGLIHWHPTSSKATGSNAKLGVFLKNYGIDLGNDSLKIGEGTSLIAVSQVGETSDSTESDSSAPTDSAEATAAPTTAPVITAPEPQGTVPADGADGGQPGEQLIGPKEWKEGEFECDGKPAQISVNYWSNFLDTDDGRLLTVDMEDAPVDQDFMVFGIYVTNEDQPREKPPWAKDMPELGGIDAPGEDYGSDAGAPPISVSGDPVSVPPAGSEPASDVPATTAVAPATTAGG